MKEGWEYINFKDVYPIKMGKTPPRSDKSSWDEKKETHNKWVSIADISNNEGKMINDTKEYISNSAAEKINTVSKGSLLMSFKLSIGRMAFAGDDLYTNEAIIAIPESKEYILRFIYYYLLSYNWLSLTEGNEKVKGATLNKTSIGKIQLPVLSPSEQQSIVDYLDSAFAKIDAMKANAEKALNEAKALFQASLKEMLELKEGWEEITLPDISENLDSIRVPVTKKNRSEGKFPYYGASGIVDYVNDYLFDEDILLISEDGANLLMRTYPIAFSVSGKVWVNNHAHVLRFKDMATQRFIEYFFAGFKLDDYISGAAQPKLTQKALNSIPISIPKEVSEQQAIVATLDSLKSKVDRLQANYDKISQECDALKQAILRQVFE